MCEVCDLTKQKLLEWTRKQGHDVCWYYPEIFQAICLLHGIMISPCLPKREHFRIGCKIYETEIFENPISISEIWIG